VSANVDAGFSIVSYTGTGATLRLVTVLVVRLMMIVKEETATFTWRVYHASLANTQVLYLSATSCGNNGNSRLGIVQSNFYSIEPSAVKYN
jgi:hypothetical protein